MTWSTKDEPEEICFVEEFFKKEAEKPVGQRQNFCHIHCPCRKCQKVVW